MMGSAASRGHLRVLGRGSGRASTWALVGLLVVQPFVFAMHPDRTLADAILGMLFVLVAMVVHLVIHEAAHALVALALGMGVPEVELGQGAPLLTLRIGSTKVTISGFHSGATHLQPRSEGFLRTRLALVTAAGPVSNLATAVVTFWLLEPPLRGASFGVSMIAAGLLLGVVNLVPFRVRRPSGTLQTDGAAMLSLLVDGRAGQHLVAAGRLDAVHRQYVAGGTVAPAPEADQVDRTDPVILGIEGTRQIFTGEYAEAVTLLREAVAMPHDDEVRALSLNNLAWALLLGQPEGWLEEAERASAEAEMLRPGMEAMLSTRGCILVHCGDYADARPLLLEAVKGEGGAPHERVLLQHHLLRAEMGLGNLYGARSALLAMVDHGAGREELATARALLREAEVDNALTHLVGADGRIRWAELDDGRGLTRHVEEMRSALAAFAAGAGDDAGDDPRRGAVHRALGG